MSSEETPKTYVFGLKEKQNSELVPICLCKYIIIILDLLLTCMIMKMSICNHRRA